MDPRFEYDACGVAFVVDILGRARRDIVATALGALCDLDHRGASGAEVDTGDGAGILIEVPDRFLWEVAGFPLLPTGAYGVGLAFVPGDPTDAEKATARVEAIVDEEGLRVLGWRDVPVDDSMIGPTARYVIGALPPPVRRRPGRRERHRSRPAPVRRPQTMRARDLQRPGGLLPVAVSRTMVYKETLATAQLSEFFPDLADERVESALALVHSRFSTNTFPSWPLAHPYRFVACNAARSSGC